MELNETYCDSCGEGFGSVKLFKKHHCGEALSDSNTIEITSIKEEVPAIYPCELCNDYFENSLLLNDHMKNHAEILKELFLCTQCCKPFKTQKAVRNHEKDVHGTKKFECGTCQKKFKRRTDFNKHNCTLIKREYFCEHCSYSAESNSKLKRHMRIHGEKEFICASCSKAFFDVSNLQNHEMVCSGENSNKCNICYKAFDYFYTLKRHMETHGEKKFICAYCQKGFFQLTNLKNHEMLHTGEQPYKCTVCHKTFIQLSNLKSHKRKLNHWTNEPHELKKINKSDTNLPLKQNEKDFKDVLCNVLCKTELKSNGKKDLCNTDLEEHFQSDANQSEGNHEDDDYIANYKRSMGTFNSEDIRKGETGYNCSSQSDQVTVKQSDSELILNASKGSTTLDIKREPSDTRNLVQGLLDSNELLPKSKLLKDLKDDVKTEDNDTLSNQRYFNSSMRKHESLAHSMHRFYPCEVCAKVFKSQTQRMQHMKLHAVDERYKCDYSGKQCINKDKLEAHARTHTGGKCHKNQHDIDESISRSDEEDCYEDGDCQCEECGKGCCNKKQLQNHLKQKKKKLTHGCDQYEKVHNRKSRMEEHLSIHTGVNPEETIFACETCPKTYSNKDSFKFHVKYCHERRPDGPDEEKPFQCDKCTKAFYTLGYLEKHRARFCKAESNEESFHCDICSKAFKTPGYVEKHRIQHFEVENRQLEDKL